ncbi:store-operated calcium entry-associated regulatory factor isoform X2 [Mobula birostris]|uniref:store-operated calcium entry-associated regulatory factor isoform X2 n=1 Tax=Mobula birostris TaxID=1983395 RepID=UPI003B288548
MGGLGVGVAALLCFGAAAAAHDSERVLLREVQALTLYSGRYTNGRRASPVPQLHCVGGTAGCNSFIPQVVQCYNKGWDGYDVQWECKADMDIAYRFGAVTVSCEGYNFPEDPYILRGSCGLEYVLDLTEEGLHRPKANSGFSHQSSKYENPTIFSNSSNIIVMLLLFGLAYLMYMTCLRIQRNGSESRPQCDEDLHSTAGPSAWPPPPGFKPAYTDLSRAVHFMNSRGEVLHFTHSKGKRIIGNPKTQEAGLCQALVEQKEDEKMKFKSSAASVWEYIRMWKKDIALLSNFS